MSSENSNLSSRDYGYDIVLATTQTSINANLKTYFASLKKDESYVVLVFDREEGRNKQISWDDLMTRTRNVDPFSIPDGTGADDGRVVAMREAFFVAAFKVEMGLPSFDDPMQIPDIVELEQGRGGGGTVKYRLLCADIKLAGLVQNGRGQFEWQCKAQSDERNRAWAINTIVNLKLNRVSFQQLSADMQAKTESVKGEMREVQQLAIDLNSAIMSERPRIDGFDEMSEAYTLLTSRLLQMHCDLVRKQGSLVLSCVVSLDPRRDQDLGPTDVDFRIGRLIAEKDPNLRTLSLVCATNGRPLPYSDGFRWDWISGPSSRLVHGVIAVKSETFARLPGSDQLISRIKDGQISVSDILSSPVVALQKFIFPGGSKFEFVDFRLSKHGDFLASIKFADPARMK